MARKITWTEPALVDLIAATDFIRKDSLQNAVSFKDRVFAASRSLEHLPYRGHIVGEIKTEAFRELFVDSYRLIYRVLESEVVIAALVHKARNLRLLWVRGTLKSILPPHRVTKAKAKKRKVL